MPMPIANLLNNSRIDREEYDSTTISILLPPDINERALEIASELYLEMVANVIARPEHCVLRHYRCPDIQIDCPGGRAQVYKHADFSFRSLARISIYYMRGCVNGVSGDIIGIYITIYYPPSRCMGILRKTQLFEGSDDEMRILLSSD